MSKIVLQHYRGQSGRAADIAGGPSLTHLRHSPMNLL
jgi:hypothetical protein